MNVMKSMFPLYEASFLASSQTPMNTMTVGLRSLWMNWVYRQISFKITLTNTTMCYSPTSTTLLARSSISVTRIGISPHYFPDVTLHVLSPVCNTTSATYGTIWSGKYENVVTVSPSLSSGTFIIFTSHYTRTPFPSQSHSHIPLTITPSYHHIHHVTSLLIVHNPYHLYHNSLPTRQYPSSLLSWTSP